MPTLLSIDPVAAAPGDVISLSGSGFVDGMNLLFTALIGAELVETEVVSGVSATAQVPNLLMGDSGQVKVTAINLDGTYSDPVDFTIEAAIDAQSVRPLCSMSAAKRIIGVSPDETFDDARLASAIAMASAQIVSYCRETFQSKSVTETYDGDGTAFLQLQGGPTIALTKVEVDGVEQPISEISYSGTSLRFEETEWNPRTRSVQRVWSRGVRNISVTRTKGYKAVPADITQACLLQVAHLWNLITKQGIVNEGNSQAGVTTAYSQEPLAPAAKQIANRYRSIRIGVAS